MPRVVVAATYVKIGARMDLLWDASLKLNTVHVFDVARAVYWAARKAEPGTGERAAGERESARNTLAPLRAS